MRTQMAATHPFPITYWDSSGVFGVMASKAGRLPSNPPLPCPHQQAVGIGFASTNYELNVISSYYWDQIHVHSNVSYARNPYNTNYPVSGSTEPLRTNAYAFSIAPVWVVNVRWRLALDFGVGSNILLNANRFSDYGMVAAIYSITPDVDLGLSIMRSAANFGTVFSGSGVYSLRSEAGITWRF